MPQQREERWEGGELVSVDLGPEIPKTSLQMLEEISNVYRIAPIELRTGFAPLAAQVEMFLRRNDLESAIALVQGAAVPEEAEGLKNAILEIMGVELNG